MNMAFRSPPFLPPMYGRGGNTVFSGTPVPTVQRGRGVGAVTKSLGRAVIPLVKTAGRAVLRRTKPLAKQALKFGKRKLMEHVAGLVTDALAGQNIKASAKRRAQDTLAEGKRGLVYALSGAPPPSKKRKKTVAAPRQKKRVQRGRGRRDVFG